METYIGDLVAVLHRAGPRAVLRYAGADTSGTDLLDEIRRYARALAALGIGPGSLVALFAPNRPEALAVRYAAHLIGSATAYLPAPVLRAGIVATRTRLPRAMTPPGCHALLREPFRTVPCGLRPACARRSGWSRCRRWRDRG